MAVRVQDTILPKNDADFPVVDSGHVKGGHHEVADATARDAISAALRSVGMKVVTQNDGKTWQLDSNATTWTEFTGGGGGGTLAGDVTGPSGANVVSAIQGVASPDHTTKTTRDLVEVVSTTPPSPTLLLTSPHVTVADSTQVGVIYVGEKDDNNATQTPMLSKYTIVNGVVTASSQLDLSAIDPQAWAIQDLSEDAQYVYVALDRRSLMPMILRGYVAIIDKATFTVAGWATVSNWGYGPVSVAADGAGNFFVYDDNAGQISKYQTSLHVAPGGQIPGNSVTPTVQESSTGISQYQIRFGGGSLWAVSSTQWNPPYTNVVTRYNPNTLDVTAAPDGDLVDGLVTYNQALGMVWDSINGSLWVVGSQWNGDPTTAFIKIQEPVGKAPLTVAAVVHSTGAYALANNSLSMGMGPLGYLYAVPNHGPYVGIIDPVGATWVQTVTVNADLNDTYFSLCASGTYIYLACPSEGNGETPTIDFLNVPSLIAMSAGSLTAEVFPTTWRQRYQGIVGDLAGPIAANVVEYLKGVATPDPTVKADGDLVSLHEVSTSTTPPLGWSSPTVVINDANILYVGEFDDWNGSLVPKLHKYTMTAGTATAIASLDFSQFFVNMAGINDLAQDATYVYVALAGRGWVAIVDKTTFTVVGWATVSTWNFGAQTLAADGAGNFYVLDGNTGQISKYQTSLHIAPGGQTPGNGVAPMATEVGTFSDTRRLYFGGGYLWASAGWNYGPSPVLRAYDPSLATVVALTDFGGGQISSFGMYWDTSGSALWVSGGTSPNFGFAKVTWSGGALVNSGFVTPGDALFQNSPAERLATDGDGYLLCGVDGSLGVVDMNGVSWVMSFPINGGTAPYTGIAVNMPMIYFAAPITKSTAALDYVFAGFGMSSGPVVAASTPPIITWSLRYSPVDGDVQGPVGQNQVRSLHGVALPKVSPTVGQSLIVAQNNPIFSNVLDLYLDKTNNLVWAGDLNNGVVSSYDADTLELAHTSGAGPGMPGVRRIIGDGTYTYVCTPQSSNRVVRIHDSNANIVGAIRMPVGGGARGRDIALDGHGFLWVADNNAGRVRKYDIAAAVAAYPSYYSTETETVSLSHPLSLCYGGGYLWVGQDGGFLWKVSDTGVVVSSHFSNNVNSYFGLTFAKGCVWAGTRTSFLARHEATTFPLGYTEAPGGSKTSQPTYDESTDTILAGDELNDNITRWSTNTTGAFSLIETFPGDSGQSAYTALAVHGKVLAPIGNSIEVFSNLPPKSAFMSYGMKVFNFGSGGGGGSNATQLQSYNINAGAPAGGQALVYNVGSNEWTPTTTGGDASGGIDTLSVTGLRGTSLHTSVASPTDTYVLTWSAGLNAWYPAAAGGGAFVVGGDLVGSSGSQSVRKLYGNPIGNIFVAAGTVYAWSGVQWEPVLPNGDLSGSYYSGVTVSRINGGTAPATPLVGDVGKVIGVTGAGTYGLITAGGSVAGPQTGNNYPPIKVDISNHLVQSWINLNGGYGFDTNDKDGDVSGVLRAKQVAGAAGVLTEHIGRSRITPNDEQIPAMGIYGSTTKNSGRFLKLVDGSAPSGIGYDSDASKMAVARAGCFDLVVQPAARYISPKVIPLDVDPQDDYDGGGQTYHPQTYGRVVLKGNYAYSIATWGNQYLAFLETDITRGTVRKLASYGSGTLRTAFLDCAHDGGYSVTGDSDVFAVWWKGFGNDYWVQNLTLGTAAVAGTITVASGTVTSIRVARPAGVTFPTSPSGRIFVGLSTGQVLEYNGAVNPPVLVRTLSTTISGAITAMTSSCYFSGDRLWTMDAAGHIERFDIVANTWSAAASTGFTNVVAMRSGYSHNMVMINATSVATINVAISSLVISSTLTPNLVGDIQWANYTDLAWTTGDGNIGTPLVYFITDSLNGGFWRIYITGGVLSWSGGGGGGYDSWYDLNGLATWSKAGLDLSDNGSYTSAIPVRSVLGGDRISGAYFRGHAATLTVGTALKVVLGSTPTEVSMGSAALISRPGSKDIVYCLLTAGSGPTSTTTFPLTGVAMSSTGAPTNEVVVSGLCIPASSVYAIDTSFRRLMVIDTPTIGGGGNARFFPPLSAAGSLGYGLPAGLMVTGQDGNGALIMVCGNTYTAINTNNGPTRREYVMWQKTINLPSLGGAATSICSAGSWFFVASANGEVHQYLLATGAFVRTIVSSETGFPITKVINIQANQVCWVTGGAFKHYNRVTVGSATIDATGTFPVGVTPLDIANDFNFGSGTYLGILTATGVYWLQNYFSGSPSQYVPAPDNTSTIAGAVTLSHIVYVASGNAFWVTDSGKDAIWEVHASSAMPTAWPVGGVVDYI